MKIQDINLICDLVGVIDTSIIGYSQLWNDFRLDYPELDKLINSEQPPEVMTVLIPVIASYVSGWMRASGHKEVLD